MIDKPKAASTPNAVFRPSGRRAIGNVSVQSPIGSPKNLNLSKFPKKSSDEDSQSNDEHSCVESDSDKENTWRNAQLNYAFCNCLSGYLLVILAILIVVIYCMSFSYNDIDTLDNISLKFPAQVEDFWQTINISIKEIKRYNRPQSLIFIYKENRYLIINKLLSEISKYATCELTFCEAVTVVLKPNDFKTIDVLNDYGVLIEKYREALVHSGVMVVSNLEQIPGKTAQAFHSFCDEQNPVVPKALFLFTMKVDEIPKNKSLIGYVENLLSILWKDIRKDNIQPLITRMTSNVLPVF